MDVPGAFANNNKYNLKEWKIKCNLERHPGQKWLFKGEIRIWSGTRWFCQHNCERAKCTICKGGSICEHLIQRANCKICGNCFCIHKKRKYSCKICCGSSYCEHNIFRGDCLECWGETTCKHKIKRRDCESCGETFCIHKKLKYNCKKCDGGGFCIHKKRKETCIPCGGSQICRICKSKRGNPKYDKLCVTCAIQEGYTVYRNYKTKELSMVEFITQHTDVDWVNDKAYDLGCSNKRPDMVCDLGSHILIIECDENKHKHGNYICENKRIMELSQDFSENNIHRPIVVIRFNPDSYVDYNNQKIESCWKAGKDDILRINNKENWDLRLNELLETTYHYIANQPIKDVTFEYLFYDDYTKIT